MWRAFYQDHLYDRLTAFLLWSIRKVAPWKDDELSHRLHELAMRYEKQPGDQCINQPPPAYLRDAR